MQNFVSFEFPPPNVAQVTLHDRLGHYQIMGIGQCMPNDIDPHMSKFL